MTEELVLSLVSYRAGNQKVNKWGLARFIYENTDKVVSGFADFNPDCYIYWLDKWSELTKEEALQYTINCTNSSKHLESHFPPRGLRLLEDYKIKVGKHEALFRMIRGIKLTNSEIISLRQFVLISVPDTGLYDAKGIQALFGQWDVLDKMQKLAFAKEDKQAHVVHV